MTQRVHPLTAVVVLAIVLVAIMIGYSRRLAQPTPVAMAISQRHGSHAAGSRPQEKRATGNASASCAEGGSCAAGGAGTCAPGEREPVTGKDSEKLPAPVVGE